MFISQTQELSFERFEPGLGPTYQQAVVGPIANEVEALSLPLP